MKKVLKTAIAVSVVLATSASAEYSLWELGGPGSFPPRQAAIDEAAGAEVQGGPFFMYDDAKENDATQNCVMSEPDKVVSVITNDFPAENLEEDVTGPWLEKQKGKISFKTGNCGYAFVGVGFKWIDTGAEASKPWNPTTAEDGDPEGISLCFDNKTENMAVDLSVTNEVANSTGWNTFVFKLPYTEGPTHIQIPWAEFAQDPTYGTKVDFSDYITGSTGIQFKFSSPDIEGDFYLYGVGWYNDSPGRCDAVSPIIPVSKQAGFSLMQHGRVLSFTGLNGTAEVINMQGKLVSKAEISSTASTMTLNNLSTGIYMVRANNFTQKIIIK